VENRTLPRSLVVGLHLLGFLAVGIILYLALTATVFSGTERAVGGLVLILVLFGAIELLRRPQLFWHDPREDVLRPAREARQEDPLRRRRETASRCPFLRSVDR